jgi:hypothetical protein
MVTKEPCVKVMAAVLAACQQCKPIWYPVCGVDGHTYTSRCRARCKCVGVEHDGQCGGWKSHGQHSIGKPEEISDGSEEEEPEEEQGICDASDDTCEEESRDPSHDTRTPAALNAAAQPELPAAQLGSLAARNRRRQRAQELQRDEQMVKLAHLKEEHEKRELHMEQNMERARGGKVRQVGTPAEDYRGGGRDYSVPGGVNAQIYTSSGHGEQFKDEL